MDWEKSKTKYRLTRESEKRINAFTLVFVVAVGIAVLTHYYLI